MKKLLLLLSISVCSLGIAQKKKSSAPAKANKINCYLPSGDKCPSDKVGINILETNKYFAPKDRAWMGYSKNKDYSGTVVLKSLTTDPLYVVVHDNKEKTPEEIKNYIDNVDLSSYFGSYNSGLKMDLKRMIKEKSLTDLYLLDTLGSPSKTYESFYNGKTVSVMDYSFKRIKIYLVNSVAVGFDSY
ncbi:hypothetical protein [Soonwooa sp.]|uniref:hypothetical protein n=1 Tax=Soonwooa sp. TaxID=1938592 RepID=UPI0026115606|nr:hypothetical protein [Soonwooa sp.]